jgi:hypothetical protein
MESVIVKLFENSVLGAVLLVGLWVACRLLAPLAQKSVEVTQKAIDVMQEATRVMRQNTDSNRQVVKALESWAHLVGVELRAGRRPQVKRDPSSAE